MGLKNLECYNKENDMSKSITKMSDVDDLESQKNSDSFMETEVKKKLRKSSFFRQRKDSVKQKLY